MTITSIESELGNPGEVAWNALSSPLTGSRRIALALAERFQRMSAEYERKGVAESFKGITANGTVESGFFGIHSTGVSTAAVRTAAERFLGSLSQQQRDRTMFAVNDPEWRKWMNQHFYVRQGVRSREMAGSQRDAACGLLEASLSGRGLKLTRYIMRLNECDAL